MILLAHMESRYVRRIGLTALTFIIQEVFRQNYGLKQYKNADYKKLYSQNRAFCNQHFPVILRLCRDIISKLCKICFAFFYHHSCATLKKIM